MNEAQRWLFLPLGTHNFLIPRKLYKLLRMLKKTIIEESRQSMKFQRLHSVLPYHLKNTDQFIYSREQVSSV